MTECKAISDQDLTGRLLSTGGSLLFIEKARGRDSMYMYSTYSLEKVVNAPLKEVEGEKLVIFGCFMF